MVGIFFLLERLEESAFEFEIPNFLDEFFGEAFFGDESASGVGERYHRAAELDYFESGKLSNVPCSRDSDESVGVGQVMFGAGFGDHLVRGLG